MTSQEIQSQIDTLIPKAETGEQWAEICRLEAELDVSAVAHPSTGVQDVEWLDAKVVETAVALGKAEYRRDAYKRALIAIIHKASEIERHANVAQGEWNSGAAEGAERVADIARTVLFPESMLRDLPRKWIKNREDCPRYDECERGTAECYCVEGS